MGFFFWKKKQEPQSTEGEISPPLSDSSLNPSPENKDRKTQKAERYFNKGLEFLNSTSYKDRALQQFINAGNLGYIDAIHYIGLCYFKGYGTPSNPERAVEIWQKNVLKKNPLTQYMLGYCYFHGIGIERNRIVARAYLKTAEALGNTDASKLLKEDIPSQASSASANYQPSVTATKSHPSESQSPTSQTPAYQLNTTTPWDARNIARSFSPSLNTQKEETSPQPSTAPRPKFDSSFVLFEEADILYKHALAYYVGDITNRTNITKYMNYLRIAEELGSKQAAFLLKTKESFCYTHLEAARYGSKKAEKHISYIASTGRIPVDIVTQYVRYINARTPSDDYYKFSNTSPNIAQKVYQRGLSYWVGDVYSWTDGTKGNEYLRIARDLGSHDAEFILNSEHKRLYIYLEAAKYGSQKAKEKVIELHNKGAFTGKIPKEKLNQYFIDANISSDNLLSSYEMYRRGLSYYVGEIDGRENVNRAIEYFNLARKNGSKDAKKVLDSAYTREYVYLEAAKYGSLKAKEKIIEYDRKGLFDGKIPSDSLKKYFDEIGIESVVHPKTTEEPTTQKTVDELYKDGLAYFVGDKTGRENTKEGTDLIFKASLQGSKEASFIFKTNDPYTYIFLEAAKYGSERARKRVIEWNKTGFLNKIPQKRRQEYFSAIGITEVSQAIPNEQKKSLAKDAVTKKDTAKPAPKEKQPKSTPKKPKKQEKIVIDKERLQEVKAEHLYIQNRLAIDYGDDEPSVIPVSVPLTPETPAKAEAGSEWEQMRRALSKTHIQIISALLEEPGNITKQHDIAKSEGTMLDILYDEINEISDEILGDLLIDEGELVEEYIEDVKSLCQ